MESIIIIGWHSVVGVHAVGCVLGGGGGVEGSVGGFEREYAVGNSGLKTTKRKKATVQVYCLSEMSIVLEIIKITNSMDIII